MTVQEQVLNNLELTSIIFKWLKTTTLGELYSEDEKERGDSKRPVSWTAFFAHLATVNRAFFHGSIEVLWERLDSPIPPFHNVLPADRDEKGRLTFHVSYCQHKLTAKNWDRFLLYTSKVKALVLGQHETAPVMSASWLYIAMGSEGRPTTLFPCLRRIALVSTDSLSLYIASNSMASLHSFKGDFTSATSDSTARDHARAITTGLAQNAVCLTDLRMDGVMSSTVVGIISQMKTIAFLRLTIGYGKDFHVLDVGRLAAMPSLTTLQLDQDVNSIPAITKVAGPDLFIDDIISRKAVLRTLTNLSVRACGTTQYFAAAALLPCNLKALKITMVPDTTSAQMALLPPVLAIYANRNPSLVSVSANGDARSALPVTIEPPLIRNLQRNVHYTNLETFFDGIAELRNLEVLEIRNSPFIAVDFVPKLLEIMPCLPLLRVLKLSATPATALAEHEPVLPPLEVLGVLRQCNHCLNRVEITVDVPQELPEPPAQTVAHGLKFLGLELPIDYTNYGTEEKFKLARYLDRLFPQVEMIANGTEQGQREFWTFINRLMSFSRTSRADALSDLEQSRSL